MAGDYTRLTFDPRRDRAMVLEQQGRVHLDADFNELVAILERRLRVETYDFAGPAVVPASEPDSFKIALQGGVFSVERGRIYVDGLLAENHGAGDDGYEPVWGEPIGSETTPLDLQPYLGSADVGTALLKQLKTGQQLVYLDVWRRELTAVEDPSIVEPALGVDTCTRVQTVWQIRALPVDEKEPRCSDDWSTYEPWVQLTAPSAGRLTSWANQPPAPADPCAVAPVGGYRGTENRLYRVEVHDGGGAGQATIKWSRDNGAVATRIVAPIADATTKPIVTVQRLGRDDVLRFIPSDWVELLDDEHELDGRPGIIAQVDSIDESESTITLMSPLGDTIDPDRNPRIRRWDQTAGLTNGVIPVTAFGDTIALEDGIEIKLTLADPNGELHTGDWWVFAARAASASIEELDEAPPRGIRHHYARLAIVSSGKVTDDCRVVFPGTCDCEDDCGCTVCVTPRSHDDDNGPLTIQDALDTVSATGGRVCLSAGAYRLQNPLRIENARSLTLSGVGEQTVISAVGDGLGIVVTDSFDIALEDFTIAVARETPQDVTVVQELKRVPPDRLVMSSVPPVTTAPVGEQTVAIALVNTADCRVERCFVVSGFAPGAKTSGLSINGSLGIGLGGWALRTRITDNVIFGDVAVGDLTVGRAGTTNGFAYDHLDLATGYVATVDLAVVDNLLLALSAGVDLGSLPTLAGTAKAVKTLEASIGPSLHVGVTRIVDNLVLGPRIVGIALLGTAAGPVTTPQAEPVVTGAAKVERAYPGLATAQATHTASASAVLLGELFVRGLDGVQITGNVLDVSGIGIAVSPGNLRIEGNDITGATAAASKGRSGGILVTLGSAPLGRTVIGGNAIRSVAGFGIAWSGAPGSIEVRANRVAGVSGYGIAGGISSTPETATVDDNTIEDVVAGAAGVAVAIQVAGAVVAEVRANTIGGVATSATAQATRGGILVSGCRTTQVTDNVLIGIGPTGEHTGVVYGIGYGGTLEVLDIRGNVVELGSGEGGGAIAVAVLEKGTRVTQVSGTQVGADDHVQVLTKTMARDSASILTPVVERARAAGRIRVSSAKGDAAADPVPPGAGDVAIVDNTLRSSSVMPLALIETSANVTLAQNRLARGGQLAGVPAVFALTLGATIVSSNRVETSIAVAASMALYVDPGTKLLPHCTVVGNITSRPILLNDAPLASPWAEINIVA